MEPAKKLLDPSPTLEGIPGFTVWQDGLLLLVAGAISAVIFHEALTFNFPSRTDIRNLVTFKSLEVAKKEGDFITMTQDTTAFSGNGRWSDNQQFFAMPNAVNQSVSFKLPGHLEGKYRVYLFATYAKDYGIITNFINDAAVANPVDLYSLDGDVRTSGRIDLGVVEITGDAFWKVAVTGHNPRNQPPHYYFGIDGLLFEKQQ